MPNYSIKPQAENDLDELAQYIAQDNIEAALRLYDMAKETYENLSYTPMIGSLYPSTNQELQGLRFFPIKNYPKYLTFYMPLDTGVAIIRVLHGARKISNIIP